MQPDQQGDVMYPHAPDIPLRDTLDNGFSKGLGFFFQPNEAYWVDAHAHLDKVTTAEDILYLLDTWHRQLQAYRLGKTIAMVSDPGTFTACGKVCKQDERFAWIPWLSINNTNIDQLQLAYANGAVGVKLHNAAIMQGNAAPDIWFSERWVEIFRYLEERELPIVWHVTQRVGEAPYHGGGVNLFWADGVDKGVKVTNEELLQITLKILRQYPGLKVQGAHMLYLGIDRLAALFTEYENLYVDTSCTLFVRWADILYEQDRSILHDFIMQFSDRIIFGTDIALAPGNMDEYQVQGFLCHARCIKQIRLPDAILQKLAHGNAERMYKLASLPIPRRDNWRP